MEDAIYRQAAIDAVCRHGTELERRGITVLSVVNYKQATVDLLESLPPAQRTGRWIYVEEEYCWCCSSCKTMMAEFESKPVWNYCPNCGAIMEEQE